MDSLRLRLMHREALRRLEDAEKLEGALGIGESTDSPYLLKLLGFELLLKLIYEVKLKKEAAFGHRYQEGFKDLPVDLQDELLRLAGEWRGPSDLANNHEIVLEERGKNFIALRYPYEKYKGYTQEEYFEVGERWLANGAPLDEAEFRYHPNELYGFLQALRQVAEEMADGLP